MGELLVYFMCFIVGIATTTAVQEYCDVDGYYWRDYTGDLPPDAVPGGTDANGKSIYIGQIYNNKYLIPAKIYSTDSNKAYYELDGSERVATEHIKILCSQHPEQMEWIKTTNDDIKLLTNRHLVPGGHEPGSTTYIGRVRSGREISVGKVLTDIFFIHTGLHVTRDGRGERHTSFEVLAHNPNLPKVYPR